MHNINLKAIFVLLMTFAITACGTSGGESSRTIIRPSSSSKSSQSSHSSKETTSESTLSSLSNSSSLDDKGTLVLSDNISSYYVGETFNNLFDINLCYFDKAGKELDISKSFKYYNLTITDSRGIVVDINKPFEKEGTYSLQAYLVKDNSIKSNIIQINVLNKSFVKKSEKTQMPSFFTYDQLENSCLSNLSFPTSGNVNVLVLPIEIPDFPFSSWSYGEDYLDAINRTFNGNGVEDTNYFESVKSYYKKVSKGKLNFNFEIADVCTIAENSLDLLMCGQVGGSIVAAQEAMNFYLNKHGRASTTKFDNDKDGYIDGLWMIYSAPDYSKFPYPVIDPSLFWAYCTDVKFDEPNLNSPTVCSYSWASMSFIDEQADKNKVDAHTIIHETGHLLSLPDYYSYDIESAVSSGPQGGLSMMDLNIGDQDPFSKIALGWSNPYVVTDECEITISSNESTNDAIILADHWNGTAFDEYVLFDLVTPTGVNEIDSKERYEGNRPLYYSKTGVRAYHVDARLGEFKYRSVADGAMEEGVVAVKEKDAKDCYLSDNKVSQILKLGKIERLSMDTEIPYSERQSGFTVINANCTSRTLINTQPYTNNRLLQLISRDGTNFEVDDAYASNDSLFVKNDSWTLARRGIHYLNNGNAALNNGNKLKWVVTVKDITDTSATLMFRKY